MQILHHHLPVSAEEADKRMESAGEIPFSPEEIEAMVRSAIAAGPPPRPRLLPHDWNGFAALLLASATLLGLSLTGSLPGRPTPPSSVLHSAAAEIHAHALRARRNQCGAPFTGTHPTEHTHTPPGTTRTDP